MAGQHISVLVREVAEFLQCRNDGIYVDATLGSGGHALHLFRQYPGIGRLIGIDCDHEAVQRAAVVLREFSARTTVLQGNFRDLRELLAGIGVDRIDGIVFDLGVSTPQLKDPARGFGFSQEGILDMRMDRTQGVSAKDMLASVSERELTDILYRFGQERWAKRIARHIVRSRQQRPIQRTTELAGLVMEAIPRRYYPSKIHPATRTFQALRIAVNDELTSIERGLDAALDLVRPGGRICAISFHSLEDGIVKNRFRDWEKGCRCPSTIPVCVCGGKPRLRVITRRPVVPSARERDDNPSARSARLRVGERV